MIPVMRRATTLVLTLWLAGTVMTSGRLRAAEPADFVGVWKLDPEASDNPLDRLLETFRRQDPQRSAGGQSLSFAQQRRAVEDGIRWLEEGVEELEFTDDDGGLVLRLRNDVELRVPKEGGEFLRHGPRYTSFTTEARWKKKGFELSASRDDGGRLVERYQVAKDGEHLEVAVSIRGRGRSPTVTYRRVYVKERSWALVPE